MVVDGVFRVFKEEFSLWTSGNAVFKCFQHKNLVSWSKCKFLEGLFVKFLVQKMS